MKLWTVHPSWLPDPLLQRQHQTLHAVLNGVARRKPRRGITRFLRFGGYIAWLHFLTVEETSRRGWHHETPVGDLWARLPADQRRFDYPLTAAEVRDDIEAVRQKMRSGTYLVSMMTATFPIETAGTQLIEAQRRMVVTGRLPAGALWL